MLAEYDPKSNNVNNKLNTSRRVSLANLVSVQIEKKRNITSISRQKSLKRLRNNSSLRAISKENEQSKQQQLETSFNKQINELTMSAENVASKWSLEENDKDSETYSSVINRIGEAVNESETLFEFIRKAFGIFYYTKFSTFCMVLLAIFHLAMIFIGLNHFENCPNEPKIPVYIFVGGSVGFLKLLQLIWNQVHKSTDNDDYSYRSNSFGTDTVNTVNNNMIDREEATLSKSSRVTDALINIFLFVWFVLGNYWILSIYKPHFDPLLLEPNNWCHKKIYILALIHLAVYYLICLILIIILLLLTIFTQIPYLIIKFQEFQM